MTICPSPDERVVSLNRMFFPTLKQILHLNDIVTLAKAKFTESDVKKCFFLKEDLTIPVWLIRFLSM